MDSKPAEPKPLSERILHIKTTTLVGVVMVLLNLAIISPAGWVIRDWNDRYKSDKADLQRQMDNFEDQVLDLTTILYGDYLDKSTYEHDQTALENRLSDMNERINQLSITLLTKPHYNSSP